MKNFTFEMLHVLINRHYNLKFKFQVVLRFFSWIPNYIMTDNINLNTADILESNFIILLKITKYLSLL